MRIEKVEKEYAAKYQQTKRFGVISEGCIGVWGEGRTLEAAISDAKRNQIEYAGSASIDGCWAMEIETRSPKKVFGFWNAQGCFLQSFLATNKRAARKQFLKIWHDAGGVTCREMEE